MKKINIKNLNDLAIIKILFIISFFFSILVGIAITCSFNFNNVINLIFQADTSRVMEDITNLTYGHGRAPIHPLFILFTAPIYYLIKGFVINKLLSLVCLSSLATSITIIYIYKLLSLYNKDKRINILLSLCYLFSFASYVFTASIEIYNIAALSLVILWYYALKRYKDNSINNNSFYILVVLGIIVTGITITNIVIYGIILFMFFIFKKMKFTSICFAGLLSVIILSNIMLIQKVVWHNVPTGIPIGSISNENHYVDYHFSTKKVKNVIDGDYINVFLSGDFDMVKDLDPPEKDKDCYLIYFIKNNLVNLIGLGIFYIITIILIIRNYKQNIFANTGIILALLFNTILHYLYSNDYPFLYSLHFLYLIIMTFGINYSYEKNNLIKRISKYSLYILLGLELIINNISFIKLIKLLKQNLSLNYYVQTFGIINCLIAAVIIFIIILTIIYFIIKLFRGLKKQKDKDAKILNIIIIIFLFILLHCIFIGIQSSEDNRRLLFWNTDNSTIKIHVAK